MPGAAIRNCGQAPRKPKVLSLTHSTYPTPPQLEPLEGSDQVMQPSRVLRSRGSCHLGAPGWGGSRDRAAVGMCRAPALMQRLRPGASLIGPKKDADADLGTRPQPSREGYLRPEPGGLQPRAKRKHVGTPNFCGRGGRSLTDVWLPALTDHPSATRVSLGRLKAGRAPTH